MNKVFVVGYIFDNDAVIESRTSCVCAKNAEEAQDFLEKEIVKDSLTCCTIFSVREIEYGEVI